MTDFHDPEGKEWSSGGTTSVAGRERLSSIASAQIKPSTSTVQYRQDVGFGTRSSSDLTNTNSIDDAYNGDNVHRALSANSVASNAPDQTMLALLTTGSASVPLNSRDLSSASDDSATGTATPTSLNDQHSDTSSETENNDSQREVLITPRRMTRSRVMEQHTPVAETHTGKRKHHDAPSVPHNARQSPRLRRTASPDKSTTNSSPSSARSTRASTKITPRHSTRKVKQTPKTTISSSGAVLKTLVLYHEDFLLHVTPPGHQESPGRVSSILHKLHGSAFVNQLQFSNEFEVATNDQLLGAHCDKYLSYLHKLEAEVNESCETVAFSPRAKEVSTHVWDVAVTTALLDGDKKNNNNNYNNKNNINKNRMHKTNKQVPEASQPTTNFKAHDRVEGRIDGWNEYYPGIIKTLNPDGTIHVVFDDGDDVPKVKVSELRKIKENVTGTAFSPGTLQAAKRGAGSICHAIDQVILGNNSNAFCVVRPPGHHAGINGVVQGGHACGFCFINSACVGVVHALSRHKDVIRRVAILDTDVHHGDGTQEILEHKLKRPDEIAFFSVHLHEQAGGNSQGIAPFYPGTGNVSVPHANIHNAPMRVLWNKTKQEKEKRRRREGDEELGRLAFRAHVSQTFMPALEAFNPDLIIVSAGFDGAHDDIGCSMMRGDSWVSGCNLTAKDFEWVAQQVKNVGNKCCQGRVVSVLEGGYGRFSRVKARGEFVIKRDRLASNVAAFVAGMLPET